MGGGLRVVPSLRIVSRGPPRVNPPGACGSAEGYVRRAVGALHRCAGAARRLSGRRPPVQVPASLHAPASCSAWRPGGSRGSGTPWSIPGAAGRCPRRGRRSPPAEGRCPPGHGPAADAHALGAARMAWISPAPMTASLRRSRRGCGPDGDRGPFRTRARRRRCGRPGREPSIPPPGKTATGVLPSPTPPERRWRPGPKAEVTGGIRADAGWPPTISGVMASPEGSSGGGRGGPRRGVSACRIPKALSSPVVCHL